MQKKSYGFDNKRTAKNAAATSRQYPPTTYSEGQVQTRGRGWIGKAPANGVPGINGDIPGTALCDIYYVPQSGGGLTPVRNQEGTANFQLTVNNIGPPIDEDSYFPIWQLNGLPHCGLEAGLPPSASVYPRIFFELERLLSGQESGQWVARAVVVEADNGEAYNPDDPPTPITPGDEFIVSDPYNQFPGVTLRDNIPAEAIAAGAAASMGWAYLRTPTTSGDIPEGVVRWEIEQCSRAPKLRVKIYDCLLHPLAPGVPPSINGYFQWPLNGDRETGWPDNTFPPNATFYAPPADGFNYAIEFENPLNLDAVASYTDPYNGQVDSFVHVEFIDDGSANNSDATVPHSDGATSTRWICTEAENKFARWVSCFHQGGGTWEPVDDQYREHCREGFPPFFDEGCKPNIVGPDNCGVAGGASGVAFYKPEDNEYEIISTQSALYGDPQDATVIKTVGTGSTCSLSQTPTTVKVFCSPVDQDPTPVPLPTVGVDVVSSVYPSPDDGGICVEFTTVQVCGSSSAGADVCFDLCSVLNLRAVPVVTGIYADGSSICATTGQVMVCDASGGGYNCVDICDLLCNCPEFYSLPDVCEPPPCYESPCSYVWDGAQWNPEETCPVGCVCADPPAYDGNYVGHKVTTQCRDTPDPPTCDCLCLQTTCVNDLVAISYTKNGLTYTAQAGQLPLQQYDTCAWSVVMEGRNGDVVQDMETVELSFRPEDLLSAQGEGWSMVDKRGGCEEWPLSDDDDNPEVIGSVTFTTTNPTAAASDIVEAIGVRTKSAKSLGDQFIAKHRKWFGGCGSCQNDVKAVMNRWGMMPDEDKVMRVASTIHFKNKRVPINTIRWAIMQAAQEFFK